MGSYTINSLNMSYKHISPFIREDFKYNEIWLYSDNPIGFIYSYNKSLEQQKRINIMVTDIYNYWYVSILINGNYTVFTEEDMCNRYTKNRKLITSTKRDAYLKWFVSEYKAPLKKEQEENFIYDFIILQTKYGISANQLFIKENYDIIISNLENFDNSIFDSQEKDPLKNRSMIKNTAPEYNYVSFIRAITLQGNILTKLLSKIIFSDIKILYIDSFIKTIDSIPEDDLIIVNYNTLSLPGDMKLRKIYDYEIISLSDTSYNKHIKNEIFESVIKNRNILFLLPLNIDGIVYSEHLELLNFLDCIDDNILILLSSRLIVVNSTIIGLYGSKKIISEDHMY